MVVPEKATGTPRPRSGARGNLGAIFDWGPGAKGGLDRSLREAATSLYHNVTKPVWRWRHAYANRGDPSAFKTWLALLFAGRRKYDLSDGYGVSPLSASAGLLTYYYLRLDSRDMTPLYVDRRLLHPDALRQIDADNNVVDCVIRAECLEDDLIRALSVAGYDVSPEREATIRDERHDRTNASEHLPTAFYHDRETLELVRRREQLLIDKYGYDRPSSE